MQKILDLASSKQLSNSQVTLTFKRDVNQQEGIHALRKWLVSIDNAIDKGATLEYKFIYEIGKNLKFHFHGYFRFKPDYQPIINKLLFKWKHGHGFVYLSKGPFDGWVKYIDKEQSIFKNRWVLSRELPTEAQALEQQALASGTTEPQGDGGSSTVASPRGSEGAEVSALDAL